MEKLTGLRSSINEISKEKNIDKRAVIKSLENAYKTFAKKKIDMVANMEAEYSEDTDQMTIFKYTRVVEQLKNSSLEITLKDAQKLDPEVEIGDELGIDVSSELKFSRNDINLIKQLFLHSVQKEIKDRLVDEFSSRKGELISGIIKKSDVHYYLVDLGSTEAYLAKRECISDETFKVGDKVQAVLTEVEAGPRGAELQLSRTTPLFVIKIMEQEVPELSDGLIEVTKIAREPGLRTKVLLRSNETSLNPVQVVVGNKGFRIQNVINQLQGERVNVYLDKTNDPAMMLHELVKDIPVSQTISYKDKILLITDEANLGKVVGQKGSNLKTTASILGKVVDVVGSEKLKKFHEQVAQEYRKVLPDLVAQSLVSHHFTSLDRIRDAGAHDVAKSLQISVEEADSLIQKLEEANLDKIELKADAYAQPKAFALPDTYSKSSAHDAERRLREEIRANFNIKSR